MTDYKFHSAANLFPLLEGAEFRALVEDISAHGLNDPIVLYQDKILDGRNRWRACREARIVPRFREWKSNGQSAVDFVISENLHRRHLTPGQKAAVSLDALAMYAAEAKKRQGSRTDIVPNLEQSLSGRAVDQAAAVFGVSRGYIAEAKRIHDFDREILEEVKRGYKTLTAATREVTRAQIQETLATAPAGRFRVVYADPPWKYGDTRDGLDGTTGASAHYPTMTIAELCALPVTEWIEDDAVLFLWITSPLLFEAPAVFRSWGFSYRECFVWDKIKHNLGHYNSVRHEFLLICTRGSCLPDDPVLIDSVQSIERGAHSAKPVEFREIIDRLYPHGARLEMFARGEAAEGWQVYGNE